MSEKHLVGLLFLLSGAFGGTILACLSRRVRDLFFMLLVFSSPFTERMAVNFFSREWYRGTTRGLEFCGADILAFSLLASSLLAPRPGEKRFYWPASLGWMLLYFLFAAFCVAISDPQIFGIFELSKMLRGIVVFLAVALFVRSERELRLLILPLGLIVAYEGLLALVQRYGYGVHRVFGTVDDSNSLSVFLCTTAPVFVAVITGHFPRYLKLIGAAAIGLAFIGVILTISRAGVVIITSVLLAAALTTISYRITLRKLAVTFLVMAAGLGVLAKAWRTLSARFGEASLKQEYEDKHSQGRGYYFRVAAAILEDRWFGVGPNNWSYWVSNKYGPKLGWKFVPYRGTDKEPSTRVPAGSNVDEAQAAPAHSLAALTAGEMGIGGLFLLMLLWMRWFQMGATFLWPRTPDPMRRLGAGLFFATCGIFCQSFTEWVFHQTPIFFTYHILLGTLASLYYARKHSPAAVSEVDDAETAWPGAYLPAENL